MKPIRRPLSRTDVGPRFGIEGPWDQGDPVHERITLAAVYQVKKDIGLDDANFTIGKDFRLSEFLRGVFWNDDPEVLFFDQDPKSDQNFSSGTLWADHFEQGSLSNANDKTNLTARSHFWDFQFLHSMATEAREPAATTRQRILMWAEFVYKVAIGEHVDGSNSMSTPESVANTLLSSVKIPASSTSGQSTVARYFSPLTVPADDVTIRFLLTRGDPYVSLDIGKRALGSLLHLIEDSYARGHVQRVLLNATDLVSQTASSMTFKPNTYGQWGNVITFHSYRGQSDDHKAFDDYDKDTMNPRDPTSFYGLVGANDAILQCMSLLKAFHAKTPWDSGPRHTLETIFTLDAGATPANILVNQNPLSDLKNTGAGSGTSDTRYSYNGASAYVVTSPSSAWARPPAGARWISFAANAAGASSTTYDYKITVDFTFCNLTTLVVSGKCAADDSCTILVNNVAIPSPWQGGPPSHSTLVPFRIDGHYFANGQVTLTFRVTNTSGPTGLLVVYDSIATMKP